MSLSCCLGVMLARIADLLTCANTFDDKVALGDFNGRIVLLDGLRDLQLVGRIKRAAACRVVLVVRDLLLLAEFGLNRYDVVGGSLAEVVEILRGQRFVVLKGGDEFRGIPNLLGRVLVP